MIQFIVRRCFQAIFVIMIVAGLMFFLINFGGDPVAMLLPDEASPDQVNALREHLQLDKPWLTRFGIFLLDAAKGNLGVSFHHREPALKLVLERLPASMELLAVSTLFSLIFSIPIGVWSAVNKGNAIDTTLTSFSLCGISIPPFFLGIMLILIFGVHLMWFPTCGRGTFAHLVLPSLSLGLQHAAVGVRLIRSSMLDVLSEDYVRTARSKGLSNSTVLIHHALRNALIPFVTVFGLQTGRQLTGAIVTERIFAWPGMGRLMLVSIARLDVPVVIAFSLVAAVIFVTVNLLVDLSYAFLDPRIRYD